MRRTITASLKHAYLINGVRLTVSLDIPDSDPLTVWWETDGPSELLPAAPSRDDLALTAALFLAMRKGMDLHIDGPVTRSLLQRAERFVRIWALWKPDRYQVVRLSAAEEVADRPVNDVRDRLAIAAFSGGVDASCTIWRHHSKLAGRSSRDIFGGVLVQGFDIPLDHNEPFEKARKLAEGMLADLGLPLITLRTNWKRDVCTNWESEFGLAIACCLKLWEDRVGTLLVGSCEDYSRLVVPWGSHPLPTQLLTSTDTELVYDGGEYNRTQKVAILSEWNGGYDQLRVCWQGDITGENCGTCEKCIRTKLNAIVTGNNLPKSLPGMPTVEQMAKLKALNPAQRILMEEIVDEARSHNFNGPLLDAVQSLIKRKAPLRHRLRHAVGRMRRSVGL